MNRDGEGPGHPVRWATWVVLACLFAAPGWALSVPATPQRVVVVGGDHDYPPYEWLDEQGRAAGFHVDLMRAVGAIEGFEVRFEYGPWDRVRKAFEQGQIDVLPIFRSPERQQTMEFVEPHAILTYGIYVRRGGPAIRTLADLPGRQVIVQRDAFVHDHLREQHPPVALVPVETETEALRLLASGEHDCAVVTEVGGRRAIRRANLTNLTTSGSALVPREYCFAVLKGNSALRDQISEGLEILRASGRYDAIRDDWLGYESEAPIAVSAVVRYAAWALIPLALVLAAALGWSWSLKREVARRTRELEVELGQRQRAEEALRRVRRLEAIGRLAGGVAHDFNNLLTPILGYADMGLLDASADDPLRENFEQIRGAAMRAKDLTWQLLAFGRRQLLEVRVLDLGALVRDFEKILRTLVREDIEIVIRLGPGPAWIKADPSQIEQIVMNLAINASDAMPEGGRITLEVAPVVLGPEEVRGRAGLPPGPYVGLSVRDTGLGMEADVAAHLFEPFFTTKERGEGTGLGLATVYGIVKRHGGDIRVHSEPGRGTVFHVVLPRAEEPPRPSPRPAPVEAGVRGGEAVLVVEDDEAVRRLACDILEGHGYCVLEARDPHHAIRLAQQHEGPIHLLLTDVVMPKMSGMDLYDRLAPLRPEMRSLYVSAYTDDVIAPHGIPGEGVHLLQKPFSVGSLTRKVREVLES